MYEDRYPRIADLDGDGSAEVVTIRSSVSGGASVTVYGFDNNQLVEISTTGFIGQSNRWLNIAGIADFAGTGGKQIAFVKTPHIGGTLYIYGLKDGKLVKLASQYGFSNHGIGSREMRLSAVADIDNDGKPDLALPSADRNTLKMIGVSGEEIVELGSVTLPGKVDKAIASEGQGAALTFIVGLANGRVVRVFRP